MTLRDYTVYDGLAIRKALFSVLKSCIWWHVYISEQMRRTPILLKILVDQNAYRRRGVNGHSSSLK